MRSLGMQGEAGHSGGIVTAPAAQHDGRVRGQFTAESDQGSDGDVALDCDLACAGTHFRSIVPSLHPQQHIHVHVEGLFDA